MCNSKAPYLQGEEVALLLTRLHFYYITTRTATIVPKLHHSRIHK